MEDQILARVIKDAHAYFEGYGIDFSQYEDPVVELDELGHGEITITHITSGNELILTNVWIDLQTGEIFQAEAMLG